VITRHCGGLKKSWFDGTDVPPPPMTMCTVPLRGFLLAREASLQCLQNFPVLLLGNFAVSY
jgi:hypothetical protein